MHGCQLHDKRVIATDVGNELLFACSVECEGRQGRCLCVDTEAIAVYMLVAPDSVRITEEYGNVVK